MERYREELFPKFEDGQKSYKKRRFKTARLVRERYIKLTEEKIAIILLFFLFSFVFSYIIGYRRGVLYKKEPESIPGFSSDFENVESGNIPEKISPISAEERKEEKGPFYAIQLVTYKSDSYAQDEKKKLEDSGYPIYILTRGRYKILYAGKYQDKKEAKKALRELKKIYKDAFIKEIKGGG